MGWWGRYRKMLGWKLSEISRLRGIVLIGEDLAKILSRERFNMRLNHCQTMV